MSDYRILKCTYKNVNNHEHCPLCKGLGTYDGLFLLQNALNFMDVPSHRKDNLEENLYWVVSYLNVKNSNHKLYNVAVNLASELLRNKKRIRKEQETHATPLTSHGT
jgi:hypothetical protein